ncbi:MAG TPA: GNAT family N-acetyltransferase [Pyrinomonadaceae bacterium]|nr:GNAT family N-acetyltransferase [Pyrinomonadaceae bacterium]
MQTATVTIQPIDDVAKMRAVEELQKEVWGIPDIEVVPLTQLVAAKEAGGTLIGAFDAETLVGFVYGFPSFEYGQAAHHSHMLAVKPAYRNLDLGRKLKLAQREHVIGQGIAVMTWTFDPLQSLNAHFNFTKLGVVADRYLRDFYGAEAASFLHQTGTDRLWVSWWLTSDHVKRTISGDRAAESFAHDDVSIEIPGDINSLQQQDSRTALKWREETRAAFTEAIGAGYKVIGFTRENETGKYLLRKSGES